MDRISNPSPRGCINSNRLDTSDPAPDTAGVCSLIGCSNTPLSMQNISPQPPMVQEKQQREVHAAFLLNSSRSINPVHPEPSGRIRLGLDVNISQLRSKTTHAKDTGNVSTVLSDKIERNDIPNKNIVASLQSTRLLAVKNPLNPTSTLSDQVGKSFYDKKETTMTSSPNTIGQTLLPIDMKKAVNDYSEIRKKDSWLGKVERDFSESIYNLVGYQTINNGSFGLKLNHDSSDLDLAIGVPPEDHTRVINQLNSVGKFVGVRKSTADSERHVFEFKREGIIIDLGVLTPRDYHLTAEGMKKCLNEMTDNDRITHTFMKKKLLAEGRMEEYKLYKLLPYKIYFSDIFNFVPIH